MDREKLIKQLFIGKVADIIGTQKTTELLKESTFVIDEMIKSRKADVIKNEVSVCGMKGKGFCPYERTNGICIVDGNCTNKQTVL